MNAAPQSFAVSKSVPTQNRYGVNMPKNLARIEGDNISSARRAFAALLWQAFPSPSEHDLSLKAARVIDVSPRQVTNWLRCQNSAAVHYFFAVAVIAGAEVAFRDRGGRS